MYKNISIIGAGSWGLAIANLLSEDSKTTVFHYNKLTIRHLKKTRTHPNIPNIPISKNITFSEEKSVEAELCVLAVPVQHMRESLKKFSIKSKNFLILSKGIECETLLFPSELARDVLGCKKQNIAILSGPSHAELLSKKEPTAVVIASKNKNLLGKLQATLSKDYFRVYTNTDMIGVQLGGAIKNVVSIAVGVSEGLGYKENIASAILTRSLKEIDLLGKCFNISPKTIWGLACIGDLIGTSFSSYSRNKSFGVKLAKGAKYQDIISSTNMTIEGVATSKSIFQLSKKCKVEMPICDMVYRIIYKNKNPEKAIKELMTRPLRAEK